MKRPWRSTTGLTMGVVDRTCGLGKEIRHNVRELALMGETHGYLHWQMRGDIDARSAESRLGTALRWPMR